MYTYPNGAMPTNEDCWLTAYGLQFLGGRHSGRWLTAWTHTRVDEVLPLVLIEVTTDLAKFEVVATGRYWVNDGRAGGWAEVTRGIARLWASRRGFPAKLPFRKVRQAV